MPVIGPSGLIVPPVAPGFVRSFDDFETTTLGSLWGKPYKGRSGGAQPGFFLDTHTVLKGDSLLRLEAYQDPQGIVNCWEYDPTIAASVYDWCGAGIASAGYFPVGTTFTWACKWDPYPGITAIVLSMGKTWPPEQDFMECNASERGAPITKFTSSYHYDQANHQVQIAIANADFSQWHAWQAKWTETGTVVTLDGDVIGQVGFTSAMTEDPTYGLLAPQFLALQTQTGDPNNPPPDATVTAETPVTMYVDWVAIDVPES